MKLDKQLFDSVAKLAAESPRLRMNYDLRDSVDEDGQRMLNVLLPGTKSAIHRHTDTSYERMYAYLAHDERLIAILRVLCGNLLYITHER